MKQEQRYNIFKRTHKGLRSMLFDAGAKIQQTDFTKNKQAHAAIDAIKQSTRSFLYHLSKEDNIVYHSVVLYAPYIVAMIEQTNLKDEALARSIDQKIDQYKGLNTKKEMIAFGHQLQAAFFEFTAAVLQHMNKEETVLNELLWSYYTDKEIIALENKVVVPEAVEEFITQEEKISKGTEFIKWMDGIIETARIIITPQVFGKGQAA